MEDNKAPDGLIEKEKMAEILADIHITEAALSIEHRNKDSLSLYTIDYYYHLSNTYDISFSKFLESFNYYLERPEQFREIYENVNEILSIKRGEKW